MIIDQGDNNRAIFSARVCPLDDYRVAIINAGLDHRIAIDFKRIMFPRAINQAGWNINLPRFILNRFNRRAGGDAAVNGQLYQFGNIGGSGANDIGNRSNWAIVIRSLITIR